MGWNFERVIYTDSNGEEYVKINGGFISLIWCLRKADDFIIY